MIITLISSLILQLNSHGSIRWKSEGAINDIGVARISVNVKSNIDYSHIILSYNYINNRFIKFENINKCNPSELDIRVISNGEINNSKYFGIFSDNGFEYYGRYFRGVKVLYITPKALTNKFLFAHELAHYFYDSCIETQYDDFYEHEKIKKFLETL